MPTVAEMGTSFNLPNYRGRVHQLTPSDTPFTTALLGTAFGGGQVTASRTFEWQTFDLREADQRTVVDGDRVGTPEHRSRGNVFNVLQTHREDVDLSYEKLAQIGQFDGQNITGPNPVVNEEAWQLTQRWKEIKRDIEFSLLNGVYTLPVNNSTPARTRGIDQAIVTNRVNAGGATIAATLNDSGNTVGATAHGLANGTGVILSDIVTVTTLEAGVVYYVVNSAANTFQLSATRGGAPITIDDDGTAVVQPLRPITEHTLGDVMQSAWDAGGLQEADMRLLIVNSIQKRWLTQVYVTSKGLETRTRNVGGASVEVITTDFGEVGVMLNRYLPQHRLLTVSLEQCQPWFRFIPGKGVMFAEPTAKNGASNASQLYTSIGLEYGNEAAHGAIDNATVTPPVAA